MRSVLITGAAGGLGRSTAHHLAARGFEVYASDLPSALEGAPAVEGVTWLPMDVRDEASIARAFAEVRARARGLDGVVNFAGVLAIGSMIELPVEAVERVLDVNLFGAYRVNRAFFPLLQARRGRIVNISSETGWQSGGPFNGAYALSKHALEAYTDSLRRELMLLDMHVIKIQPGPFRSAMVQGIDAKFEEAIAASELFEDVLEKLRRFARGEEAKASDPALLAEVVREALTARRPRAAYSVLPDRARSALEYLPTKLADRLLGLLLG